MLALAACGLGFLVSDPKSCAAYNSKILQYHLVQFLEIVSAEGGANHCLETLEPIRAACSPLGFYQFFRLAF